MGDDNFQQDHSKMSVTEAVSSSSSENRNLASIGRNNFDFCRFWLAIMVIFSHSFALSEGNERNEPLGVITNHQIGSGSFAVNCFFAISGFLITHSWLRSSSASSYLLKRILRIYPAFIIAVLVGLFVVGPLVTEHFALSTQNWLTLPAFLAALRPTEPVGAFPNNPAPGPINGSLWTVAFEFKCYIALMVMGFMGLLDRYKKTTACLYIFAVIASIYYPAVAIRSLDKGAFAGIVGDPSNWSRILPWFLGGITFYLFRERIPWTPGIAAIALAVAITASVLPPAGFWVYPFVLIYLLFWFSLYCPIHFDRWASYGDFSYGIYLYAFPIQQIVAMKVPGISPLQMFLISTPLSVIAGILSWHLVEKHFIRLKPRPTSPANSENHS